ncbi:G2/mitotic-specific cyclin [Naganishia albida]|nr:G2/mitotic-specific cyclin [Naganishia albida]
MAMKRVSATSGVARVKTEYPAEGIKKVSSATTAVRARRAALGELSNKENLASRSGNVGGDTKADVKKAVAAPSRPTALARRNTRQVPETTDAPIEDVKRPALNRRATSTKTVNIQQEGAAVTRPRQTRMATTERLATTSTNIPKRAGLKRTHTATSVNESKTTKPPALSKNRVERDEQDDVDHEPSSKRQRTSSPGHLEDTDVEGNVAPKKLFSRKLATTAEYDDALDEEPMIDPASDVSETNGRDPRVVVDMDVDDEDDPTMVLEYQEDIFEYMRDLEYKLMPNHKYMDDQPNLKWEMRGILTDWLIEVHNKFRLLPETLFLAVNIADRFLSARVVSLSKLQLVGLTCLFIAAKYEEVICPSVSNFLYMADGGYTDEEIIAAEKYVLTTLNFDLSYPNPMHFLRRVSKAEGYDIQSRTVAKYLMEISLVDERFLNIEPSRLAASATWMARLVLGRDEWDATLTHYSGYEEKELLEAAQMYLDYILDQEYPQHDAFMKKYSARKYMKAAPYVRQWAESQWPWAKAEELEHDEIQILVDERGPLKMYRGLRR